MSLKAFHIIFVTASTVLAVGFGAWAFHDYLEREHFGSFLLSLGAWMGAVGLVVYGRWFLRKMKGVSFL